MSGAQTKAAVICGAIGVVAEINPAALKKRHEQGWVMERVETVDACIQRIKSARKEKKPLSLAFLGNIVELWERLAEEEECLVELGSDQTSCHVKKLYKYLIKLSKKKKESFQWWLLSCATQF